MTHDIYLDGNATTCVLPAAIAAATDMMGQRYGNPSSSHSTGLRAKVVLDAARASAMRLLGVGAGRLMFNSGATEGIQTAVLSALVAVRERQARGEAVGTLFVYGATEHKAVPESLAHWNRLLGLNLALTKLPVDSNGLHDLAALRALAPDAAMICTMAANNETGVVSDLAGIEAAIADSGSSVLWMVDCVQALGKLPLNLATTRIDYAPFSGHKLYAPKGIGMLYVRAGAPYTALVMGGGQEAGWRSGTENMAGIAALGAVLSALERGDTFRSHAELQGFRARLAEALRAALPGVVFNNPFDLALPTTINFSVPGVSSRELMDVFDAAQVRVSAGSACSASKAAPSYVLDAMGVPLWRSAGAIRLSFGALIDEATIADACARIARCGAALRASALLPRAEEAEGIHGDDGGAAAAGGHRDGLLQLGVEGACSWLVFDGASGSCVIIDPLPELAPRIEATVRGHNYQVRAIVHTTPGTDDGGLAAALGRHYDSLAASDGQGWPVAARETVTLDDGVVVAVLHVGSRVLASVPAEHGSVAGLAGLAGAPGQRVYLLGMASDDGRLSAESVSFAFSAHAGALAPAVCSGHTLRCPTRAAGNVLCSGNEAISVASDAAQLQLSNRELDAYLAAHPDTLLVDVRETYEFAATIMPGPGGRVALSVPLSRLVEYASRWLHEQPQQPIVFYCRSGNRSLKAAQCLRRLGHPHSYSLTGGLALAALPLAA